MSKQDKMALVPRLRFPEFIDSGDWELKSFDAFFSIGSSKRVLQKDWINKGIPFYRTRELVSLSKKEPFSNDIFISEEIFSELSKKYGLPSDGDFLVSGVGTLGICYQVKKNDKFYFKDGNVLWFKLNKGLYSTYFKYCFQSDYIQKQILGQTSKSTVGTYTIQNANKTNLWCPQTLNEQKKIADCLSSLDDLITAEDKKLATLKLHKKGLMQKLFPAEGKTVPEFRFPEFRDSGDWEEKKLGDVGKIVGGGTPSTKNSEYWNGEYPWVSSSDLIENNIFRINVTRYISKDAISNSATKLIEKNSVIIVSRVGVGKVALNSIQICTSQDFTNLTQIKEVPLFLAYYMSHRMLKEAKHLQGTSIKGVTVEVIKNYSISFPTNQEQKKIADCLSSLDDIITAQAEKIEIIKAHKKGLLQGLFPSVDEVG